MKSDRFYLACLRDTVGTNVSFHCKDGKGYSTDLRKAHVYTRDEAQKAWENGREFDLPLCSYRVDQLAVPHVDCQYIPSGDVIEPGCTEYVAFQKARWNGNDVFWRCADGNPRTDFDMADRFSKPSNGEGWIWIPWETANSARRPTFDIIHINRRTMIQAAGLVTPLHIQRQRRRSSSGKTRFNCPSCGRIHWQYNPYDFEGCENINCELWKSYLNIGGAA